MRVASVVAVMVTKVCEQLCIGENSKQGVVWIE